MRWCHSQSILQPSVRSYLHAWEDTSGKWTSLIPVSVIVALQFGVKDMFFCYVTRQFSQLLLQVESECVPKRRRRGASPCSGFASFLWGLVYLDFPLHCSTPTWSFPTARLHLQPVFINFFHKAQQNRGRAAPLHVGGQTQPRTLSMNFSSSPSPSVIDKQSLPYTEEGVVALTEGGMLWGENIVQQWHRSNLGLTEWFHQGLLLPQSVWPRGPCQPCC